MTDMIPQGFPLFAVAPDGEVLSVIGWQDEGDCLSVSLVSLDSGGAGMAERVHPGNFRFTTDPRTERPDPIAEASEAEIRNMLVRISTRLIALGATGPARQVMEVLDK